MQSRPLSLLLATALLAACTADRLAPTAVSTTSTEIAAPAVTAAPTFLAQSPNAPPIANPVISFWAKKGVDRSISMYYRALPGGKDSVLFMFFRVRAKSLSQRPDGTPFAPGDSILITATLIDASKMAVDFQPSGLVFAPGDPARLKFSYFHADNDFNHDGKVSGADNTIEKSLKVWKQESALDPWQPLVSKVTFGTHEVEADIGGFTGYVIAW